MKAFYRQLSSPTQYRIRIATGEFFYIENYQILRSRINIAVNGLFLVRNLHQEWASNGASIKYSKALLLICILSWPKNWTIKRDLDNWTNIQVILVDRSSIRSSWFWTIKGAEPLTMALITGLFWTSAKISGFFTPSLPLSVFVLSEVTTPLFADVQLLPEYPHAYHFQFVQFQFNFSPSWLCWFLKSEHLDQNKQN